MSLWGLDYGSDVDENAMRLAEGGYRLGQEFGTQRRNAQGYRDNGMQGVEDAAGRAGDLETVDAARTMTRQQRQFEDDERQNGYEMMERIAPLARATLRRARQLDPSQRAAFLNTPHIRSRFEDWGIPAEDYDQAIAALSNAESAEQTFADLESAFTQHQNPEWQLNSGTGQVYAVDPSSGQVQEGGRVEVAPDWQTNGARPYRVTPEGAVVTGSGEIPHRPNAYGMGTEGYSVVTPEEVEGMGLPPGSYQRNNVTGQITVLGRQRGQYTDAAAQSAQFADRMNSADQTLVQLEAGYISPAGVFLAQSGAGNQYERQARQAQREFVNAILRRESGAVISDTEFASASQQYFPQPGDGQAVIAQKRAARRRAAQGLMNASQGAYEEWYGEGSGAEAAPPPAAPGSVIGAMVGARGVDRAILERPREIPEEEWRAMTPEERDRVIQILGRRE